jgi:hypothetical protein
VTVDPGSRGWNEHRHRWDVPAGTIRTADLADGSVTTPKLVDASVTTPKIADSAVTVAKLSLGAVSNVLLDAVTTSDIYNGAALGAGVSALGARFITSAPRYTTSQVLIVVTAGVLFTFTGNTEVAMQLYIDDGTQKIVLSTGLGTNFGLAGGVLLLSGLSAGAHAIQTFLNLGGAATTVYCRPATAPTFEGHRIKMLELMA